MKYIFTLIAFSFILKSFSQNSNAIFTDEELSSEEFKGKIRLICSRMYDSTTLTDNPAKKLEAGILEALGKGEVIKDKEKFVSQIINSNCIFCNASSNFKIRDNEPFLKRLVSSGNGHFIKYITDENDKYTIDFNIVEMVDGEEETILDYLDKILESNELSQDYDNDEIETLIEIIEENGGIRKRIIKN